jgi:hypothetical protein
MEVTPQDLLLKIGALTMENEILRARLTAAEADTSTTGDRSDGRNAVDAASPSGSPESE